jgi:hypothetical protein
MFQIACYTHNGVDRASDIKTLAQSKDIPALHYGADQVSVIEENMVSWGKTSSFDQAFVVYKTMEEGNEVCHFIEGADAVITFLNDQ